MVVGTILGAGIALAVAVVAPGNYTARVTLLVTPALSETGVPSSDALEVQAYIPTLAELATTRPVLDRVIARTGVNSDPDTLAQLITTHVPAATSLLTINVSSRDPEQAAAVANAIAAELPAYTSPTGSDPNSALKLDLTVVDPARQPTQRDGPGLPIRIALGGAIALFLTVSIAFVVENIGRGAQNLGQGVGIRRRPESMGRPMDSSRDAGSTAFGGVYARGGSADSQAEPMVDAMPPIEAARTEPAPERDSSGRFLSGRKSKPRTS